MAAKSDNAVRLDKEILGLRKLLKTSGFSAQRRLFNRNIEGGIVNVVYVEMLRPNPPGTYSIPGLREDLYGTFRVNTGIFVPEVSSILMPWAKVGKQVLEADCCIRRDVSEIAPEVPASPWAIDSDRSHYAELEAAFENTVLPFLDRHRTRESIVSYLNDAPNWALGGATRVIAAVILTSLERKEEAANLLKEERASADREDRLLRLNNIAKQLNLNTYFS